MHVADRPELRGSRFHVFDTLGLGAKAIGRPPGIELRDGMKPAPHIGRDQARAPIYQAMRTGKSQRPEGMKRTPTHGPHPQRCVRHRDRADTWPTTLRST